MLTDEQIRDFDPTDGSIPHDQKSGFKVRITKPLRPWPCHIGGVDTHEIPKGTPRVRYENFCVGETWHTYRTCEACIERALAKAEREQA